MFFQINISRPKGAFAVSLIPVQIEIVGDDIGDGLSVRGRARAAAENVVVDLEVVVNQYEPNPPPPRARQHTCVILSETRLAM